MGREGEVEGETVLEPQGGAASEDLGCSFSAQLMTREVAISSRSPAGLCLRFLVLI